MSRKKCLIMCRTGMGSSMMLKIIAEQLIDKNHYAMDVTHDALDGYMGQSGVDVIVTMADLTDEFKDSGAYVIGVHDIMDSDYLEQKLNEYFASQGM